MTPIQTNKPVFFNSSGEPLSGTIYIGQPDADPRTSPKTVTFRDSGGSTFTASQPLTTINGRITYNGKPIVALVDGEYSMLVFDSAGVQVDYSRSVNDGGTTGGGIGDFSEVTRVGLTLSEVKAFDVAVGETVENIGKSLATDGLGEEWLVISATGSPGDDIELIDFDNGLQGRRISKSPKPVLVWADGPASSVLMSELSVGGDGEYIIESNSRAYSIKVNQSIASFSHGSCYASAIPSEVAVTAPRYSNSSSTFSVVESTWDGSFASNASLDIDAIYKLI